MRSEDRGKDFIGLAILQMCVLGARLVLQENLQLQEIRLRQ